MKILGKNIKAIIFDMDGTLIDSTTIWYQIDKEFFNKRGFDTVPEEYGKEIVHLGLQKGAEMTIAKYGFVNDTVEGILKEWRDASFEQYAYKIPLKEGALEALKYCKENGLKIALATANDSQLYKPCLERLGIKDYFDVIMDVDEIKIGKSSPKIYNEIISRLDVKKDETIVFEDALTSLKTAYDAGYIAVAVHDITSEKQDLEKQKYSYSYVYKLIDLFR